MLQVLYWLLVFSVGFLLVIILMFLDSLIREGLSLNEYDDTALADESQ